MVAAGTGNAQPTAYEGFETTNMNTTVLIDILFQDKPDSDPDTNNTLKIVSIGGDMRGWEILLYKEVLW